MLTELRKAGIQVWLTYHASWWGNPDFQKAFQGLYVHLEPYWTVGWTDKAGEEVVNR